VITQAAFDRMIPLAERFERGVAETIRAYDLPWHVVRLGTRVEYRFGPTPPRDGGQAEAAKDHDLDRLLHLYCLNRGILLTPFHSMALVAPSATGRDVDRHTRVFRACVRELVGRRRRGPAEAGAGP